MDTPITVRELLSTQGWLRLYENFAADFEWTEESFLSSIPTVTGTLVAYVVVVYGLRAIFDMLGVRRPKEGEVWNAMLKFFSIIHNANMMLISLVCFIGIGYEVYAAHQSSDAGMGLYNLLCDPEHKFNKGKIIFWIYVYYLSKYVELFDTMLIVLKRSSLRTIHTYHHVATMALAYMALYLKGTGPWLVILLNTFVHIIMYFYYLLVCLDVRDVWWKNHLTDIQLTQFVLDSIGFGFFVYADVFVEQPKGNRCAGSLPGAIIGLVIVVSYFFLFLNLRIANARKARKAAKEKAEKKDN